MGRMVIRLRQKIQHPHFPGNINCFLASGTSLCNSSVHESRVKRHPPELPIPALHVFGDGSRAAAKRLLHMPCPESISYEDWAVITAKAHKGLGWIDTTRRALPNAESEFEAPLKLNPKDAQDAPSGQRNMGRCESRAIRPSQI